MFMAPFPAFASFLTLTLHTTFFVFYHSCLLSLVSFPRLSLFPLFLSLLLSLPFLSLLFLPPTSFPSLHSYLAIPSSSPSASSSKEEQTLVGERGKEEEEEEGGTNVLGEGLGLTEKTICELWMGRGGRRLRWGEERVCEGGKERGENWEKEKREKGEKKR